jgi:putative glycosyltransferase (TIGR04372 family)
MKRRSFYPIFPPQKLPSIFLSIKQAFQKNGIKGALKLSISLLIRYYYPRIMGILLYPIGLFFRGTKFLRVDLDHFGPITHPYLFSVSKDYDEDSTFYVLSCDFPNSGLEKGLPDNIIILKNPWYWMLFGGFFFCSCCSLNIIPNFPQFYNDQKIKFSDFEPLSRDTEKIGPFKKLKKYQKRPSFLLDLVGNEPYILLYNREPGWNLSIGNSQRNIELGIFKKFLETCHEYRIKVIRYGGAYMKPASYYNIPNELLFDYSQTKFCTPENDLYLWANCRCIIGSLSGATLAPSTIFGKPMLYIGLVPLFHIPATYGLLQHSGSVPSNAWFAIQKVLKNQKEIHLRERLKLEREKEDFYSELEILPYSTDFINDIASQFLKEYGYGEILQGPSGDFMRYQISSEVSKSDDWRVIVKKDESGPIICA